MRPRDRYLLTVSGSLALAVVVGLALNVAARFVFDEPTPTALAAIERALDPFRFGTGADGALALYGLALALGLIGFALGTLWGYGLLLAALAAGAIGTFNPVAAAGTYIVARSWHHFLHLDVHRVDAPVEWRHILTSGLLLTAVFGHWLADRSPVALIARLAPRVTDGASIELVDQTRAATVRLAEERLIAVAQVARVLRANRERTDEPYPASDSVQSMAELKAEFPAAVQDAINRLPVEAAVGYWSNGSSFLLYAALPSPFTHPRRVAVIPPAETVLVRTDADPDGDLDFDGLPDETERTLGTSPVLLDTDADGYPDGTEVGTGHDPLTSSADGSVSDL